MAKEEKPTPCAVTVQVHPHTWAVIQAAAVNARMAAEDLLVLGGFKISRGLLDNHPFVSITNQEQQEASMVTGRFDAPTEHPFFSEDKPQEVLVLHQKEMDHAKALDPEWFMFYEDTFDHRVSATDVARLLKHAPTPYTKGLMIAKLFALLEVNLIQQQIAGLGKSVGDWLNVRLQAFKNDPEPIINICNALIFEEAQKKGDQRGR